MNGLEEFGTATIHEASGQNGALPSSIKPLAAGMRVCGPAFPVRSPGGDNLMLHAAILAAPRGSVIVADAGFDTEAGPWGDLMTLSAMQNGITGLVISGSIRDGDDIAKYGFPVFCVGRCIRGTTKKMRGPVPDTIRIGEIKIMPGDVIVGDDDGVVVVAAAAAADVAKACREREDKEESFRQRMNGGESLQAIMGLNV